jgi:eukaryotic-like serine/threonine-protein kinase
MTPTDRNADEDALAQLLAEYDEALAGDTPAAVPDSLTIDGDAELMAQCQRAQQCLELLDRVRRRWSPPGVSASTAGGNTARPTPEPSRVVTIGRFQIERELGRGGLGIVHLAFDPKLGRRVALKVPRFELLVNDDLRRRFLRESEAAARMSHPNLVTVFEAGEDGTICFITSEFCEGPNLAHWLQSTRQPVEPRVAALALRRLALAVQHAHGRGVLHRDIKPSNILLDTSAAGELPWEPKLTDFGMAKLLERTGDETRAGAMIGTPAYMAPEQAEGRVCDLDARTDLYSLGAVLYELLTRRAPASGASDAESLRKVLCEDPVFPRDLRDDIPRDLEAICLKCLARRREHRYTTAQELADDLQRFLIGQPTEARPLSTTGMALNWARRRPTLAAVAGLSIIGAMLAATGMAAYTLKIRRHAEELSQALAERDEANSIALAHSDATVRAYPADMRLAQRAWNEGRTADARMLLEKHSPRTAGLDHRSFAWQFLRRLCQFDDTTLAEHRGAIHVCRYSPDGQCLVTAGQDGEVRVWNADSGSLERSWSAHDQDINGIVFSPDGRWIVTTAGEQGAIVWEFATGNPVHRFEGSDGIVCTAGFTPDGKSLITGTNTGAIDFWKPGDWSPLVDTARTPESVRLIAVSHDGSMMATTSNDTKIRLWDLPGLQLRGMLEGHSRDITAIDFAHHALELVSASRDGTIKLWSPAQPGELATYEAKEGYIHDVTFTPDDGRILLACHGGDAQIWERATNKRELVFHSGGAPVYSASMSPDGRRVATAGGDEKVHLWHTSADAEETRLLTNQPGRAFALSSDGRVASVGDFDGRIRYFNLADGKLINQHQPHDKMVDAICTSPNGDLEAVAFHDGTISLWHLPDMTLLHTLSGHLDRIWNVRFSAHAERLASCSNDGTIRVWDAGTGRVLHVLTAADDNPQDVVFSPDGLLLATGCRKGTVRIWRADRGTELARLAGHEGSIVCVAWSPDGKLLASGARNDTLCLWDTERWRLLRRIVPGQELIQCLCFSPDGKSLASGSSQGTIKLWDVALQEEVLHLGRHSGPVNQVFFSDRGDVLYSFAPGQQCELFSWPTR